jgi:hypothetical protein
LNDKNGETHQINGGPLRLRQLCFYVLCFLSLNYLTTVGRDQEANARIKLFTDWISRAFPQRLAKKLG